MRKCECDKCGGKCEGRVYIFHSTALCSTALNCTPLHCTVQHCTELHCSTALNYTAALHSTAQHNTLVHSTPPHSTPFHYTALHSTPQYSTAHHSTPLDPQCPAHTTPLNSKPCGGNCPGKVLRWRKCSTCENLRCTLRKCTKERHKKRPRVPAQASHPVLTRVGVMCVRTQVAPEPYTNGDAVARMHTARPELPIMHGCCVRLGRLGVIRLASSQPRGAPEPTSGTPAISVWPVCALGPAMHIDESMPMV